MKHGSMPSQGKQYYSTPDPLIGVPDRTFRDDRKDANLMNWRRKEFVSVVQAEKCH